MSESRFQIEFDTQIWCACAVESSRYAINGVQPVQGENGSSYLVATDGRCCAISSAQIVGVGPFPIIPVPKNTFKIKDRGGEIEAWTRREVIEEDEEGNENSYFTDTVKILVDPERGNFPKCEEVIPECDSDYHWIGLNAELLARLVKAVGGADNYGGIMLGFKERNKPIAVYPIDSEKNTDSFGVIMPLNCEKITDPSKAYNERAKRYKQALVVSPVETEQVKM